MKSYFWNRIIIIILLSFLSIGTLALLKVRTDTVVNTFKSKDFSIKIEEDFTEGDLVKNNVFIKNTGDIDMYVRVKIVVQVIDDNNNIIYLPIDLSPEDEFDTSDSKRALEIDDFEISKIGVITGYEDVSKNWFYLDGYYYYKHLVNPQEKIPFFKTAELKCCLNLNSNYTPVISILAEGVQINALLQDNVWDNVFVNEDSILQENEV